MQGIHLFTFRGIPVGFNPAFLIIVLILTMNMGSISEMLIFGISVVLGILIHEFGHALTAQRYGLKPAIMLHGFGGLTAHAPASTPKEEFLITLAGPCAGLLVGGVLFGLYQMMMFLGMGAVMTQYPILNVFIMDMIWVNLAWGIFNLIPCRPMDGSKVLSYILGKFMKKPKAEMTGIVISLVLAALILIYSLFAHSIWMIILSCYFIFINFVEFKQARLAIQGNVTPPKKLVGIQAETLYEKGRTAAREHDWKSLELYGHQMKKVAEGADQIERAYELLTIACTNLEKYEEALNHSAHARESDAVRQAIERCKAMLD